MSCKIVEQNQESEEIAVLFENQKKKYKKLALVLLVFMGLSFLSLPILFFINVSPTLLIYAFYLMFFSVVVSALPVWLMNKCPACGKYQGKTAPKNCVSCKALLQRIQKD